MAVTPLNDYGLIKLDEQGTFSAKAGDAATSGILIGVPELTHYGMYSMAFEGSLMNEEVLMQIEDHWSSLVGKRVYWLAMSERGAILSTNEGRFALVKFTSLMAYTEPDEVAESITDKHGGSFSA